MFARARTVALLAAVLAGAAAAPASASIPPKTGHYAGTSTTHAAGNGPQAFEFTVTHGTCAAAGSTRRHHAYCVAVNTQTGPQATCGDGAIAEEFFPAYEPIALSASRTISHTYTLYADAGGQVSDRHLTGTSKVGTFQFSLKLSTSGTATGAMNYSVAGCDSGAVTIKARRTA